MPTDVVNLKRSSFMAYLVTIFPGVSAPVPVFLAAPLVLIFLGSIGARIYFAVRFIRRPPGSCDGTLPPKTITRSNSPVSTTNKEVNTTTEPETDVEATAGTEDNCITHANMMAATPNPIREGYLGHVGEYKSGTSVERMFPRSPGRKYKELKGAIAEYECFCQSLCGQIAGHDSRGAQDNTNPTVNDVLSSHAITLPAPTQCGCSSCTNAYGCADASDTSSRCPSSYLVTPIVSISRPASRNPFNSTSSLSSSLSSHRFSEDSSITTPCTPILQVRDVISCPTASSSSSTASLEHEGANGVETTPTPASRQQRASAPTGMRPLLLVQKVNCQAPQAPIEERTLLPRRVLGEISNRSSTTSYNTHDTTVSRIVKIGGMRHRDMRPTTLGY